MNHDVLPVTAHFEQAALEATHAEDAYRKKAAAEISHLEALRLRAYRRVRLIKLLETATAATASGNDPLRLQRSLLCREFGWSEENAAQKEVLDQMKDVCLAVQNGAKASHGNSLIQSQLEAFERWFIEHRKTSFYTLFDQYVQETPVVDF